MRTPFDYLTADINGTTLAEAYEHGFRVALQKLYTRVGGDSQAVIEAVVKEIDWGEVTK